MVEFKQDATTGTPYFMEVNGRFWRSLQPGIDATWTPPSSWCRSRAVRVSYGGSITSLFSPGDQGTLEHPTCSHVVYLPLPTCTLQTK